MKNLFVFILTLFVVNITSAQVNVNQLFSQHPEVIIKFQIQDRTQLETLTQMVSIDKVTDNEVIAYANQKEFEQFLTLNIPYEIVERPILTPEELNMVDFEAIRGTNWTWNGYPTYDGYIAMMQNFATTYPNICRLVEFGTSVQGRKLLACVLSNNVNVREAEPQVFWSSTMHGDETTGYVLMLRYIDSLLNGYGNNDRITYLLDNMEIWINPLANPDGTYWGGNNSVSGARRANANNKDLNRNYTDWYYGEPTGSYGPRQKETQHFMDLQAAETFVLGVNLHGGSEVCNYPWDNRNVAPADNAWWQYVCKEYADTVFAHAPSNYMKGTSSTGYIRGYAWYQAIGSRQDYANYYNHNREFTLEISNAKTPTATQLPNFWNYNYRSFFNYTQQALYGIHGIVTNACSGEPISAKISIPTDINNSFVMTDPRMGYYVRLIKSGDYLVTYSADGYIDQTVSITVTDHQQTVQNIALVPISGGGTNVPVANFEAEITEIFVNETVHFTDLSQDATAWLWTFEGGTPETSADQNPIVLYTNPGKFDVRLKVFNNGACSNEKAIKNYITVKQIEVYPIAHFEADKIKILENETVNFSNLSENATTWQWYFEGGTPETSTEQNQSVKYEHHGSYAVTLVAKNEFGQDSITKKDYITVVEATMPLADFSAVPTSILAGETVSFTNLSKNATAWEWYFEGGTPETSTEQNPSIKYEKQGIFSVKLIATNEFGNDDIEKLNYITVAPLSINDIEKLNVKIYPNPVAKEKSITIETETTIQKIEWINLLGIIVKTTCPKDLPYNFSVSGIEKGIYFLKIETEKGGYTTKLIIQ